ncbi:hypothetical protein C8R45DRAFT_1189577 [Mycena sanguinolenta]|nr:hypothetical protein C8R45DRAFT_1189577 [Mycena sanguinolenta]
MRGTRGHSESSTTGFELHTVFLVLTNPVTDGASVFLFRGSLSPSFPNDNNTWTMPVAPLTGQIKPFNNKCLDVTGEATANGIKLQIWTCAPGNTNQLFTFQRAQIEWAGQGKCLDLTDGRNTPGNQCVFPCRFLYSFGFHGRMHADARPASTDTDLGLHCPRQ